MLISTVIDRALECGLVTADEAVWQGVTVDSVGRSHPVFRLSVGDEPRAFIKFFGPSRGETDGEPSNERAVIALADREAVAAAIAPPLSWDGDERVIVTQALRGQSAWVDDYFGGGVRDPRAAWAALVAAAVPTLAGLHLGTRDLAASKNPGADNTFSSGAPWGLRLFSSDAPPELWADPFLGELLHTADQHRIVRTGVRAARESWRTMCLIHGDLKHDNVLMDDETGRAFFVDWEMARLGDPAWDLAALMARLPMMAPDEDCWNRTARDGARELVDAYIAATPLTAPALASRLVLYTATWLVMAAVQARSVDHSDQGRVEADALVAKAASTFGSARELTQALMGGDHG